MAEHVAKNTLMYKEAVSAPHCLAQQFGEIKPYIESLNAHLKHFPPRLIMTCARGSSAHAAIYAKFLIETMTNIPVMATALSVFSVYKQSLNIDGVLFLAISQSGQSPDLLASCRAAKLRGALIVALVNDTQSPLAQLADYVLPMGVGPEHGIAATKSFLGSLSALAHWLADWCENQALLKSIRDLPPILEAATDLDWSAGLEALRDCQTLFVVSRGFGLAAANEAALKLQETAGIWAQGLSAAEIVHGPMTLVGANDPVLIISTADASQDSIDDVARRFNVRGACVLSASHTPSPDTLGLELPTCDQAALRPLVFIQAFYVFTSQLSFLRGRNPDAPAFLQKVTQTL